jgi:hypothetical protein
VPKIALREYSRSALPLCNAWGCNIHLNFKLIYCDWFSPGDCVEEGMGEVPKVPKIALREYSRSALPLCNAWGCNIHLNFKLIYCDWFSPGDCVQEGMTEVPKVS